MTGAAMTAIGAVLNQTTLQLPGLRAACGLSYRQALRSLRTMSRVSPLKCTFTGTCTAKIARFAQFAGKNIPGRLTQSMADPSVYQ